MTAPVPREKKIGGPIAFVSNAYGVDLFGPNGGLPLENYEEVFAELTGTLTITGGTTSGAAVYYNPRTLIKSIEVKLTGSGLPDGFVELPMSDLEFLNIIETKGRNYQANETPISNGDIGVYTFRGIWRLPFAADDMPNPYQYFFNASRFTQSNFRIRFGTVEDLVAGGDRAKVLSNVQVQFWGRSYSFDPKFDAASQLLHHQRLQVKEISLGGVGAQTNFDIEIPRTPSFLRGIWLYQCTKDANGVETPINTLITDTSQVMLHVNDGDRKFEYTMEILRDRMRRWYNLDVIPFGYSFIDCSPRGDEYLVRNMYMLNFSTIKVRIDNASVANSVLRVGVLKYTAQ